MRERHFHRERARARPRDDLEINGTRNARTRTFADSTAATATRRIAVVDAQRLPIGEVEIRPLRGADGLGGGVADQNRCSRILYVDGLHRRSRVATVVHSRVGPQDGVVARRGARDDLI